MSIRYKDQTIANVSSSSSESLPIGAVIMWAGTQDTVPDGWHICNGEEGTIDLRDRFVLGAGTNEPGVTGGESEVTLTVDQMPSHYHQFGGLGGYFNILSNSGSIKGAVLDPTYMRTTFSTGSDRPHNNMPPYYVLWYIQKIRQGASAPSGSVESLSTVDITNIMEEKNNG